MLNLDHLRFLPDNYRSMLPNYGTYDFDSVWLTILIALSAFLLAYGVRSLVFVLLSKDELGRIIQARRESEIPIPRRHDQFISILVATYNEHKVIERLLESCVALTYNAKRFEIVVIDDSLDGTFAILSSWKKRIPNLKVIHRSTRDGWKGGALNAGLNNINQKSQYVLVIDADNVLVPNTLDSIIAYFLELHSKGQHVDAIQGYLLPLVNKVDEIKSYSEPVHKTYPESWVSKAIDFRRAQRNMVEFVAKNHLGLPVEITGSLFLIRTEVIKEIGFSGDLTEDWDLTIDLHLPERSPGKPHYGRGIEKSNVVYRHSIKFSGKNKAIAYNPVLVSYCETATRLRSYLKQRIRISEGHARGLKRRIWDIPKSNIGNVTKIELFFTGLQYAKFIPILALIISDSILISGNGIDIARYNQFIKFSFWFQIFLLGLYLFTNIIALNTCRQLRNYNIRDVLYLFILNLCAIPVYAIGTLRGFLIKKGTFYRTERNNS
jgi:cellulose synthase/poly-beta-1,6-N-acetylglucosamine synthase-like glycosyltransferase